MGRKHNVDKGGKGGMTITIYEGYDSSYVLIGSKDERFAKAWGQVYRVPVANLYREMVALAEWVNNEFGEACLFEVD